MPAGMRTARCARNGRLFRPAACAPETEVRVNTVHLKKETGVSSRYVHNVGRGYAMAGKPAALQAGVRLADYLSTGLLPRVCTPEVVEAALAATGRHSKRQRDLPAHAVAYYVMALSLYRGVNYQEVLRVVTEGMQVLGDMNATLL